MVNATASARLTAAILQQGQAALAAATLSNTALPYVAVFTLLLIWSAARSGGWAAKQVSLPPLLGILGAGVLLRNVPGQLVSGLPQDWASFVTSRALSLMLVVSGLELEFEAVRKGGAVCARLTLCPGLSEALVAGAASVFIFGMRPLVGLCLGFVLAAVSPAVVVNGMFQLQRQGYGVQKGIPSLAVAAASFDDVLAITGFTICLGLAVPAQGTDIWWAALHGPLSLLFGMVGGMVGGLTCSPTLVWDKAWKRSGVLVGMAALLAGTGQLAHLEGAGPLACLIMAITAARAWSSGQPHLLSAGPDKRQVAEVQESVGWLWEAVGQPLLFGVIGAQINLHSIVGSLLPRALVLLTVSLSARIAAAYLAVGGVGLEHKERLFLALSWVPKATVQAALAPVPLRLILRHKQDDADFLVWEQWGQDILTTAVISIILTAPAGLLIIQQLGPRWLTRSDEHATAPARVDEGHAVAEPGLRKRPSLLGSTGTAVEYAADFVGA